MYINLDRIYNLRLTFEIIAQYEQLTGKKLAGLNLNDLVDLSGLCWLMMKQHVPEFKEADAVKLTAAHAATIKKAVLSAFTKPAKETEPKSEFINFDDYITAALDAGIAIKEFWSLTPAEFNNIQKNAVKQQRENYNSIMRTAWYTAKLTRAASIPDLEKLLIDVESAPKREQTPEEMMNACRTIAAMFGGA